MKEEEFYNNKKIEYLKRIIIDTNDYHSNPSYEMFNKLQSETQNMILFKMMKKTQSKPTN